MLQSFIRSIDYLEKIISLMPGHVYWLDNNNVYQGCNYLQAKAVELNSPNEIIGKRNRDLIWKEFADDLDNINREVMQSGKAQRKRRNYPHRQRRQNCSFPKSPSL